MQAQIRAAGRTDIGRKRSSNQDHFLIADLCKSMHVDNTSLSLECPARLFGTQQAKLLLVADGMGGHQAGRRASALAIDFVINALLNSVHWPQRTGEEKEVTNFLDDLSLLLSMAHRAIEADSSQEAKHRGMGTTFTLAYILWPHLFIAHAGDSRCYLLRNAELKQLTQDHTMANQMVASGGLKPEDAARSPWGNVLWNALGGGVADMRADVQTIRLQVGDALIMCSDGLNKHVNDHEILDILNRESDPDFACRSLIDLTNFRGGTDNVTAVIARLDEPISREARTSVATQVTLERLLSDITGPPSTLPPGGDTKETIDYS